MSQKPCSEFGCARFAHKAVRSLEYCLQYNIEFSQRHYHAMEKFLEDSRYGFYALDTRCISRLFALLSENYENTEIFRCYLLKMLHISATPLLLQTTSDSANYRSDIAEYFSMFGDVMLLAPDQEVLELITSALKSIFLLKRPYPCCIPKDSCSNILLISRLPSTALALMTITSGDVCRKLLSVIHTIMQSDEICFILLKGNIINVVLTKLGNTGDSDFCPEDVRVSLKVLTRLVLLTQDKKHSGDIDICIEEQAWRNCHATFRKLVTMKELKALRNSYFTTILNVFLTTMHADKCVHFPKYFLIDCAMLFSTSEVRCVSGTWAEDFFYTADVDDYQFKTLLMAALLIFAKIQDPTQCLKTTDVFLSLFHILDPDFKVIWTDGQRLELIRKAVMAWNEFLHAYIDVFVKYDGPSRLLTIIKLCIARNYPGYLILPLLRCLFTSITTDLCKDLHEEYRNNGSYFIMIDLATRILQYPMLTREDQNTLTLAFFILEKLNSDCSLQITRVLQIVLGCLCRFLNPKPEDIIFSHNIIISAISLLWMCLIDCDGAKMKFIKAGGIYTLLDVLQKVSRPVKIVILGLALDLMYDCENSIPCFLTWRGTNSQHLIHILLDTFKEESELLGANFDTHGVIQDIEKPLMGKKQYSFYQKSDGRSSPSIMDMLASSRPKIYGILTILNCPNRRVDLTNENYRLQPNNLCLLHQITKLVAENYLELKVGEAWQEVFNDLGLEQAMSSCFNRMIVGYNVKRFRASAASVRSEQLNLLKEEGRRSILLEHSLYRRLCEDSLAESLDALTDLIYLANGSEQIFRLTAKMKQARLLKESRILHTHRNSKFHETFAYDIYVSKVFNQSVGIKSNIVIKPFKKRDYEDEELELVSPIDSGTDFERNDPFKSLFSDVSLDGSSISDEFMLR